MNIPELLKYKDSPENSLHEKIRKAICARYNMSLDAMSERHEDWRRAEEDFRGYTPESTEDKRRKATRASGNLEYTTITVPMTYAMALTAHTYWSSVFLNRDPIFQVDTRKGSAEHGAQAMEAILDYQVHVGRMLVPLFNWLLDPPKYGFGVLGTFWEQKTKRVARMMESSAVDLETGLPIPGRMKLEKVTEEIPGYRGNSAYNVRPQNFYPDTRVPLIDFQKGEFCCDTSYKSYQSILQDQSYFNLDAVKSLRTDKSATRRVEELGADQLQLPQIEKDDREFSELSDRGVLHILRAVINLIPKEWGLGDETLPEKWAFEISDQNVIISAEPFGHIHDEFPWDVLYYEVDGYVLDIRGMMEIGKDMNTAISWQLNSHMFNVRRALNDQLIYDPSRIVAKDLLDGGPGKLLRLKPIAYGTDVRAAITQLPVQDITRQNVTDMQTMAEIMQRMLGVNDNVMGTLAPGGRKTATEVRTASTFSISRLKTIAEYFSATGFTSLCSKMIANTQQFYFLGEQGEEVFKVVGELAQGMETVDINPQTVAGAYDFKSVDGTLPIDRMAQANIWKELLLGIVQSGAAPNYNIDEMFNWIASLTGVRSLKRFKIQALPDQQVQEQAKAGNIVPIQGGQNAG